MHRRLVDDDPEKLAELEKIHADDDVARKIYDLRTKADLSQRALAKLVGTTASVICADYDGYSLAMLNRIATARQASRNSFSSYQDKTHSKHAYTS